MKAMTRPRYDGKVRASVMDAPVCHECREPIDYKLAYRIPAADVHPPGTRYLVCSKRCAKGQPVVQIGA